MVQNKMNHKEKQIEQMFHLALVTASARPTS